MKIAIVGASARAAAQSARRAGYDVIAADMFADRDLCQQSPATRIDDYPEGLASWLEQAQADAWFYTGALENYPDLLERMSRIKPLWGNRGEAVRAVRDLQVLQSGLREAGLRCPETRGTSDGLPLDGSWLCKTGRSSSGQGVWRLDSLTAEKRAQQEHAQFQQALDQSPGVPASALFSLGRTEAVLIGITQQVVGPTLTGAAEFQYAGSLWPLHVDQTQFNQIERLGQTLLDPFGLRGLVGVDLWLEGSRVWVLEVNPRYTAAVELLERATDLAAVGAHAAAWDEGTARSMAIPSLEGQACGKLILFAKRELTISPAFSNWAMDQATSGSMADIPHPGECIQRGWPIVTLFANGAEADVQGLFASRVEEVESRLYAG